MTTTQADEKRTGLYEGMRAGLRPTLHLLRENPWVVALSIGAVATIVYAWILRYYDTAYAAAGWSGLAPSVDQKSALARAVLAALLFAVIAPLSHMFGFVAFDPQTSRQHALLLVPLCLAVLGVGIALSVPARGDSVGILLGVGALFMLFGAVAGLVGRAVRFIRQRWSGKRPPESTDVRADEVQGWLWATVSVLVLSVVVYIVTAGVDDQARSAVAQIRAGEPDIGVGSIVAPLDMRLVRIAWIDPALRPAYEPIPEDPLLLVLRGHGRTLLVEARPRPGRPLWGMDAPDGAVTLKAP